jgi:ABC-type uncharacterized transport system fused permease/ATPase subunit
MFSINLNFLSNLYTNKNDKYLKNRKLIKQNLQGKIQNWDNNEKPSNKEIIKKNNGH